MNTLLLEILQEKSRISQKGKTPISITGLKNIDNLVGVSSVTLTNSHYTFSENFGFCLISKPSPQKVKACKSR